jgi:hypothetical protein
MVARFEPTISSTQLWKPDLNPQPIQYSYEAFHQSNQKHSKKKFDEYNNNNSEFISYILKIFKIKNSSIKSKLY